MTISYQPNPVEQAFLALEQIGNTSSLKEKQAILQENQDNEVLKAMLLCTYNPYYQYYVKKLPVKVNAAEGEGVSESRFTRLLELLVDLHQRKVTGNAALDEVAEFLTSLSTQEYTWYSRVITRDLKIGLAEKGINKAIPGLVPVYEVMLADKVNPEDLNLDTPKALKMLPNRIVTQYKIDGYRLNIHVDVNHNIEVRTRNGKVVEGYTELEQEAREKLPVGYVYDGEIVAPELFEWIASNTESSQATVPNRDLFTEAMSHAFSHEENKQGIFNMFDMVPISEWKSYNTTESYEARLQRIQDLVSPLELKHIVVVPTSRVYLKSNPDDMKAIVDEFHYFLDIGWEGLMIKNLDSPYEFKRTKNLLKMKLMDTIDLVVTDVFEGRGKYAGMMGGVYVDYKGYPVGVGSGWDEAQRRKYWDNPNEILGKTLEIHYQAETTNKNGGLSLSFPVVKSIRTDK